MATTTESIGAGQSGTNDTEDLTGVTLHDTTATFVTSDVQVGELVTNTTSGDTATVVTVTDETHIETSGLTGAGDNDWNVSDAYTIARDRTTIADWEAATDNDLSAATGSSTNEIGECYTDGDFAELVTISGATVDVNFNRTLRAADGHHGDGTYAGRGVILNPNTTGNIITLLEKFVTVGEGMLLRMESSHGNSDECFRLGEASAVDGCKIWKCFLQNRDTGSQQDGIYGGDWNIGTASNPVVIQDVTIASFGRAGLHAQNHAPDSNDFNHFYEISNCAFFENKWGIGWEVEGDQTDINWSIINCVLGDNSTADYGVTGPSVGTVTVDEASNNASEDDTIPGPYVGEPMTLVSGAGSVAEEHIIGSKATSFNDPVTRNLSTCNTLLDGVGTTNALVSSTDQVGVARGVSTCDIGPFEVSTLLTPAALAIPLVIPAANITTGTGGGLIELTPAALAIPLVVPTAAITFAAYPITPAALPIPLVIPTGAISYAAIGLTPAALPIPLVVPAASLSWGALGVAGTPQTIPLVIPAAAISVGAIPITPAALAIPLAVPGAVLSHGTLSVAGTPVPVPLVVPAASLSFGALSLAGTAQAIPLVLPSGAISSGTLLAPAALAVPLVVPAATVTLGTLSLTPAALAIPLVLPTGTTSQGLALTPSVVAIPLLTPAGAISQALGITPAALPIPIATPSAVLSWGGVALAGTPVTIPLVLPTGSIGSIVNLTGVALPIPLVIPAATLTLAALGITPAALAIPILMPAATVLVATVVPGIIRLRSLQVETMRARLLHVETQHDRTMTLL